MRHVVLVRIVLVRSVVALLVTAAWLATAAPGGAQPKPAPKKGNAEAKKIKNPAPVTPESITAGRRVYGKWCASCHGSSGKGDGPMAPEGSKPASLIDEQWDYGSTDGEMFVTIRDGIGPKFDMDSWEGKITEQEMWDVVNYIRSINSKPSK